MTKSAVSLGCGLAFFLGLAALPAQPTKQALGTADEFFETNVRPLLIDQCSKCHGDARAKGGLKVTSRADLAALAPG